MASEAAVEWRLISPANHAVQRCRPRTTCWVSVDIINRHLAQLHQFSAHCDLHDQESHLHSSMGMTGIPLRGSSDQRGDTSAFGEMKG